MHINPWLSTSVRTALEGLSFIDTKRIHIHTEKEAVEFLACYGFDLNDIVDVLELEKLRSEAIELIKDELLIGDESIPQELIAERNVCQYLLSASGHGKKKFGSLEWRYFKGSSYINP